MDSRWSDEGLDRHPASRLVRFCLENRLVVLLVTLAVIGWGIVVAPFDWHVPGILRDPVAVDAIPDIGENQQIVFTDWPGRSPQDVEDQVTYPLTVSLLGLPGVKTVRSTSMFGFSSIYVIFDDDVEFYWSRTRILERLASLPPGTLPLDARPALGPDATALGQVFWYTLEGRDAEGRPTGGWDLEELRSVQDWQVRYALQSARGVAEVASVGGFVREYQIDVDPDALRAHGVTLEDVFRAVRSSNTDVGARTVEVNRVEYVIRGVGFLKGIEDLEATVVRVTDNVPLHVRDVARVGTGPALRRGALDKEGAEAVGGVVVVRYGENPLAAIRAVKEKITEIAPGLPRKTLADGTVSQVAIVPFYDRTGLIYETLGTLNEAIVQEVLITVIVVIVMMMHLRSSLLISALMPLSVLMTFIAMKLFGVDANIVALSGIAIAIGTIVDMGIVLTENILKHLERAGPDDDRLEVIYRASAEVGSAVLTAVATTIIGFLPVFTLEGAEGKLFRPLAYTKTFALGASILTALTILPAGAYLLFRGRAEAGRRLRRVSRWTNGLVLAAVGIFLTADWLPLGAGRPFAANAVFVVLAVLVTLGPILLYQRFYPRILRWCLDHKKTFLAFPSFVVLFGAVVWLGFPRVFGFLPAGLEAVGLDRSLLTARGPWVWASHALPGLGREFMPNLDEGSYLYMPTTMPHAGMEEALDVLAKLDTAIYAVPEVERVVGKIGRVESALDPAPVSMVETVILYKSEYVTDAAGKRLRFRYDGRSGTYPRDPEGNLIPDRRGRPYRNWRPEIGSPDDIWDEIVRAANLPGTTSAPKLQPIAARVVMLQSGMRAAMGVKVKGPDLATVERVGLDIERLLREVPDVDAATVVADRIVGVPYLEIEWDREALARYGLTVRDVQDVVEVAIGGMPLTTTVEGRERYPVRVRYPRELRGDLEALGHILVATPGGAQIPIEQLATIRYERGPQMIRSEDTFLTGYVLFDKRGERAEGDVVEAARRYLEAQRAAGRFTLPPGVSYAFAGTYENQIRAEKRLRVLLPAALLAIFIIIYLQFGKVSVASLVFTGILTSWGGGFVLLWLYGQGWFLDLSVLGEPLRDLFGMGTVNLSVAVWVGFLALFGIATDDGVLVGTYLEQVFARRRPKGTEEIRAAVLEAGIRRVRPALMTSATTILALIPVLTSSGRGAEVMVPMAIPSFGGMLLELLAILIVPTLYCWLAERRDGRGGG